MDWIKQMPVTASLEPFDRNASVTATGPLWENDLQSIRFIDLEGKVKSYQAQITPVKVHLFVITLFIAYIAPFAGFFVAGLKRSLRADRLALTLHKGGVIDRIDCILVTGFFLMIYVNVLVNSQNDG